MAEFLIDFGDPDNVAQAIPHAKKLIEQAEQKAIVAIDQARQAQERASDAEIEKQRWTAVLQTLEQLDADVEHQAVAAPPDNVDESNSKDRALWTVIAINGPTNIAEVSEHMPEFSRKTVSWALWKLVDEGAIRRLGHGRYAPLNYVPGRPTTNYLKLPPGFPAPSKQQLSQAVEAARAAAQRSAEGKQ